MAQPTGTLGLCRITLGILAGLFAFPAGGCGTSPSVAPARAVRSIGSEKADEGRARTFVAWTGLFAVAQDDDNSAFSMLLARDDPEIDRWLTGLRRRASALKLPLGRVVLSHDELPDRGVGLEPGSLRSLVVVPNLELLTHRKVDTRRGSFHDYRLFAGASALVVEAGEGRIRLISTAVRGARVGVQNELSEDQRLDAFRKVYVEASLAALEQLERQPVPEARQGPGLVTDIHIQDDTLRSLFGITGSESRLGPENCSTPACIEMGNLVAQLAAQHLSREGEFVVPPMTGTMSRLGAAWALGAEEQLTLYAAVDAVSPTGRKEIKLAVSPEEAERFIAARVTESSAKRVSSRIEKWEFVVKGRFESCANWVVQSRIERLEATKDRRTVSCDATRDPQTLMNFTNGGHPIVYKSYRTPPSVSDRRLDYLAALQNALTRQ